MHLAIGEAGAIEFSYTTEVAGWDGSKGRIDTGQVLYCDAWPIPDMYRQTGGGGGGGRAPTRGGPAVRRLLVEGLQWRFPLPYWSSYQKAVSEGKPRYKLYPPNPNNKPRQYEPYTNNVAIR